MRERFIFISSYSDFNKDVFIKQEYVNNKVIQINILNSSINQFLYKSLSSIITNVGLPSSSKLLTGITSLLSSK